MVNVLRRRPLVFTASLSEVIKNNPKLKLSPEHLAKKLGITEEKLRCKICGKIISKSVSEYMEHLINEHYGEFTEKCERYFYEKVLVPK